MEKELNHWVALFMCKVERITPIHIYNLFNCEERTWRDWKIIRVLTMFFYRGFKPLDRLQVCRFISFFLEHAPDTPYYLTGARSNSFGVLLMWKGLLYTLKHVTKKYNVFFFIYFCRFREELPSWYSVRLTLVPPTTGLTNAPYNLFGSYYSVIFILNPIPARNFISKNFYHPYDDTTIYEEKPIQSKKINVTICNNCSPLYQITYYNIHIKAHTSQPFSCKKFICEICMYIIF